MTEVESNSNSRSRGSKTLLIFIVLGLAFCFLAACLVAGTVLFSSWINAGSQPVVNPTPDARVVLTVLPGGCRVGRTDPLGSSEVGMLTWVITGQDGDVLLERNAEGEVEYAYYRSGSYRVHIKAWYKGRYHIISNEVNIRCP